MQVQLSRLFGTESSHAKRMPKTNAQWRKTLFAILEEIQRYIDANVDTDEFHRAVLYSGLFGARESLKQEDFWPGYVEGITRVTLALLGDYPDHTRRKSGRKDADFYKLNLNRTVQWSQDPEQRFRTLFRVGLVGFPRLSESPVAVLDKFRDRFGYKVNHATFLEWYRAHYANDYATVFR